MIFMFSANTAAAVTLSAGVVSVRVACARPHRATNAITSSRPVYYHSPCLRSVVNVFKFVNLYGKVLSHDVE